MGKTFKDNKYSPRAQRHTKAERIRADREAWNKKSLDWLDANMEFDTDGYTAPQEANSKET